MVRIWEVQGVVFSRLEPNYASSCIPTFLIVQYWLSNYIVAYPGCLWDHHRHHSLQNIQADVEGGTGGIK